MPRHFPLTFVLSLVLSLCTVDGSGQQQKCIDADGEAIIVNNDVPSAKMEATARAKWSAIEQAVGAEVKAQSLVQNFALVEDVIKTQVGGVVRSYRTLGEEASGDTFRVKINACVEPLKAQQAVSALALNNSVAVFIPARKPNAAQGKDEYEETNILSETLIGKLTGQSFTVVDVAPTQTVDAAEIEKAVRTGSTLAVRSMMYKFLSNLIVIGKIDYTVSTKKGEDIGYGISMPFNNVTVRLAYRIVAKNNKTGNMEILAAGTEDARGIARTVEDAAAQGLKNLAEKVSTAILDKAAQYIQGNTKKVRIKVNGVADLDTNLDVKNMLANTVWVTDVQEQGMGEFTVGYPENTLYLANSMKQKGNFSVVNFSPYSITFDYRK
ncbi:MAG: hypothetical protein A4E73_02011 [Syntrophaceae bacterium PtaU1.Bin231]|nr:MAG: hypothetical protein A4E73_02011 [Syntrophaceae bacterium PtaU1.Bin231]HOG17988.1 hypothetical protein [Syntrophales bacterium]